MYRAFYAQIADLAWLPQLATLLFLGVFLTVLARLFVFGRREDFDSIAAQPLSDEEPHGR